MSAVVKAREPSAQHLQALQPPLVKHFEVVASAPGGVARLRELILTLAVQGKLVPQDPTDEPAAVVLDRIRAEKELLIEAGKIKREKPAAQIQSDEVPHRLPAGWQWVRLASVSKKITDGTHHSPESFATGDYKYLSAKNIKGWGIDLTDVTYVPAAVHQEIYSRCDPEFGDILYIKDGATTGVLTINTLKEQFSLLSSVGVIKPSCGLTSTYLALVLRSPFFYQAMRNGMTGVAITRVTLSKLAAALLPLPPLREQNRIVARVDELMRLCDGLEERGRLEDARHQQLVNILLETLTRSASPEDLAANWESVAANFDLLLDRPEAVDAVERTIVQLAVRGLLVPAEQAVRSDQSVRLRPGWCERRLGDVVEMMNGYAFKSEWFTSAGVRLVRNANVGHGTLDWGEMACVSPARASEFSQFSLFDGDLLLTLDRPIISTGLKLARVRAADLPCLLLQRVARLKPDARHLSMEYLVLWLLSDQFVDVIDPGRSNGVPHISTKQVAQLCLCLPPVNEQRRIVARVDQLRRHCSELRNRLAAARTTQARLASTLIQEAEQGNA